jgi:hypothetical protein
VASNQHILLRSSSDNIFMWCRTLLALAVDLLSGEKVDLNTISAEPMTPRLVQIGKGAF